MTSSDAPETKDDPLAAAAARLERACATVGARLDELARRCEAAEAEAEAARDSDADRARLAEALDAARGREQELAAAAREADTALEAAMADLAAVLGEPEEAE
ncbi:MAG: DUF4164 family protein [Oceanicaulis sp.]